MATTDTLPGTLRLKGSAWYLRIRHQGTPHYFTLGKVTEEEARALAAQKWEGLEDGRRQKEEEERLRRAGLGGSLSPLSGLVARFEREKLPTLAPNTRRTYSGTLARFVEYFAERGEDPPVGEIRRGDIRGYLNWRRLRVMRGGATIAHREGATASNRTLAKDRATLHALFDYGAELDMVDANPVAGTKAPKWDNREPVILDAEQYGALLRECGPGSMLWLYALAMGETGGRCESEVLWLQWEDIGADGFLEIKTGRGGHRTKTGKSRPVPMTPRLRDALREHAAKHRLACRTPWVFHHTISRRRYKVGDRIRSMRRGFLRAAQRAGLPANLHQHDLRHRRVVSWLDEGRPIHVVKDAMGHSTVRTTEGYDHARKERLRLLVDDSSRDELAQLAR